MQKRAVYSFVKSFIRKLETREWIVGIADFDPDLVHGNGKLDIKWVNGVGGNSWYADPFILRITEDEIVILVEEYPYDTGKGRISALLVDPESMMLKSTKVLLETDSHLSFPAYFRIDGRTFIYPENSSSGILACYELDEDSLSIKGDPVLLLNKAVADAVILDNNGERLIFTTTCPGDNGKVLDSYRPCSESPVASYVFNDCSARNAGFFFRVDGELFRPAQDCTLSYGKNVILQKVLDSPDGIMSFIPVKVLESPEKNHSLAFHTFNVYQNKYVAVDAQGHRYGLVGDLAWWIRKRFAR